MSDVRLLKETIHADRDGLKFTIFTPTYNRAHLLNRVFSSLKAQAFKSFEWIIVDDGSTDETAAVVQGFLEKTDFSLRYFYKKNEGKVRAINDALGYARGEWFIVFDSDDWCIEDALGILGKEIGLLEEMADASEYAAISTLKRLQCGDLVGDDYSDMPKYGASYVDRFNAAVKGDKWEVIKTSVHRQFPYDIEAGERYMAPSYAWLRLGLVYKTVFLNEALSIVEYQADGISRNNILHRSGSPISTIRHYEMSATVARGFILRLKMKANAVRFMLHAKRSPKIGVSVLLGGLLYLLDKFKIEQLRSR